MWELKEKNTRKTKVFPSWFETVYHNELYDIVLSCYNKNHYANINKIQLYKNVDKIYIPNQFITYDPYAEKNVIYDIININDHSPSDTIYTIHHLIIDFEINVSNLSIINSFVDIIQLNNYHRGGWIHFWNYSIPKLWIINHNLIINNKLYNKNIPYLNRRYTGSYKIL